MGKPVPFLDLIQLGDMLPHLLGKRALRGPFSPLLARGNGTALPSKGSGNAKEKDKALDG